jgi:hypothetical protein
VIDPFLPRLEELVDRSRGKVRADVAHDKITATRNRDHASHQQNRTVSADPIRGPSPKSYCAHMPGSGTHGRYVLRCPARQAASSSATARRVVRSDPR